MAPFPNIGAALVFLWHRHENNDMRMEKMPKPEMEHQNAKEVAGQLVSELLADFVKTHLNQLRHGERGIVEQDLAALIDRSIAVARAEEGDEFARELGSRFADEIEFCSAAFQDFAEIAKEAVRNAEAKYGIETYPDVDMDKAA